MSRSSSSSSVAIIGAGLSGLSLALALHRRSIPCTIYEARAGAPLAGAVSLSPNALRILDTLGAYTRLAPFRYDWSTLAYYDCTSIGTADNPTGLPTLTETQDFGNKASHGYDAARIYRSDLVGTLLAMVREAGIRVEYGRKFARVLSEDRDGDDDGVVTWEFADGTRATATLLVGADGIHSAVRRQLHPGVATEFAGVAAVTAAVPTAQLKLPDGLHLPATLTHRKLGAFVAAPQSADGSEVLIGKQHRFDRDLGREGWAAMLADKEALVRFLRAGAEGFPEFVHNAVATVPHDKLHVWPFYVVPRLGRWASDAGRVVVLGDAAHAVPPSTGQGVNQAVEDAYSLAELLHLAAAERTEDERASTRRDALAFWQTYRQRRIDGVLMLNKQVDLRRLPEREGEEREEKKELQLDWLYNVDYDRVVRDWLDERKTQ